MAEVGIERLQKKFGELTALNDVSINIRQGEFMVFVGPSGCGKTTLLRSIAGLERPNAGRITIDGKDVTTRSAAQRGIAMVFQSYALYPHMTVQENIAFGLKVNKMPRAEIDKRLREAAGILQIGHLLERRPRELSGGQRQRVAIGRAIVRHPKAFLFDEPLSNLDAELRVQMRAELIALHERLGATMIYVTHDQVEAMTMADRIAVFNQGRVEQIGAPLALYRHPRNSFVAGFIGSPRMNLLPATVQSVSAEGVRITWPGRGTLLVPVEDKGVAVGQALTLGIRPEHLALGTTADWQIETTVAGQTQAIEHLGSEVISHIVLPDGTPLNVKSNGQESVHRAEEVQIGICGALCHLFDETGNSLPARLATAGSEP